MHALSFTVFWNILIMHKELFIIGLMDTEILFFFIVVPCIFDNIKIHLTENAPFIKHIKC